MFGLSSLIQSKKSISERLTPDYQHKMLSEGVLNYQNETARLIDIVCRDGLQSVQSRHSTALTAKRLHPIPFLAAEYLDLMGVSEGKLLLEKIDRLTAWFVLHGVEHDVAVFRSLKSVVETMLNSLSSAVDSFRSTQAPAKESNTLMKLWGRVTGSSQRFDRNAYIQQVMGCIHEETVGGVDRDSDESDFEAAAAGQEALSFEAVDFEQSKALVGDGDGVCEAKGFDAFDISVMGSSRTGRLGRLGARAQYKTIHAAVNAFQKEISEITKDICEREVGDVQGKNMQQSYLAVEYLDLILEPEGNCLLVHIDKVIEWLAEHSVTHKFGFENLKAVVGMSVSSLMSAKNTFRYLRARKISKDEGVAMAVSETVCRLLVTKKEGSDFDSTLYHQQLKGILRDVMRVRPLEQEVRRPLEVDQVPAIVFPVLRHTAVPAGSFRDMPPLVPIRVPSVESAVPSPTQIRMAATLVYSSELESSSSERVDSPLHIGSFSRSAM